MWLQKQKSSHFPSGSEIFKKLFLLLFQVREERLKAYADKKSKKPALIAKTSVLLDVKPWDDETDMEAMLTSVKTIQKEGLIWGACKIFTLNFQGVISVW